MNLLIHGYKLKLTCVACPEQYDVFDDEENQVAYLRLRHGGFTACCPDVGGEMVYSASTKGDGMFEDEERMFHLNKAVEATMTWIANSLFEFED